MAAGFAASIYDYWLQKIVDDLDADGAGAMVRIYDGEDADRPIIPDDPTPTGNLLATLVLSSPCGTITDGVLTFDTITTDPTAAFTGAPSYAQFVTAADTFVLQVNVGLDGDLIPNTEDPIVASSPVAITFIEIRAPNQ